MKINGLMLTRGVDEKMFYVENLIKSIARQNVKPHEVIVAAGASGDPISEILDKYVHDVKHRVVETRYWSKCLTE